MIVSHVIAIWVAGSLVAAPIIGLALGAFKHPRVCARIVEEDRYDDAA